MGTATGFWNWMAERYARQAISDEASYEKKLAITQRYLDPGMRAVEFGCGTGSTAIVHAPKVRSYHAIDIAENMIEIARRKAAEAGLSNLEFSVGTLEACVTPGDEYDAALALNILHLVPDLDGTLATVARSLAPGGFFFSSTICLDDLGGKLRRLALGASLIPFLPTVGRFSVAELKRRVVAAGFEIVEVFEQAPGVVFLVARRCA